ncbi:hypothetical protein GGR57DRAFT_478949 [Xylariaceae sp. FL1272]|nr:hypothetical protein GGR57DRAFT_478949 [Xylariaceae sp. FL1272]
MLEWIRLAKKLSEADLTEFEFLPGQPCLIQTMRLRKDALGEVNVSENKIHESEQDYLHWINEPCPDEHTVTLVMHQRLNNAKATAIPYGKRTFITACERLYQHRSIAHAVRRKSSATFTSMNVAAWKSRDNWGPAVVYNCKSDTISPAEKDDMVFSVTHFPRTSTLFAVVYGCTEESRDEIEFWLTFSKTFAFDPLLMSMLWAELERRRLINDIDEKSAALWKSIRHMNDSLDKDDMLSISRSRAMGSNSGGSNNGRDRIRMTKIGTAQKESTQRECQAVNLWVDVSTLKSGLSSFKAQLTSMLASLQTSREAEVEAWKPERAEMDLIGKHTSDRIRRRLKEMMEEIESKIGYMDGVLGGMVLATQTESNHLSRRDALTNIYIAIESKKDSSHMRYIALLGMIFLPGTFFATLFSMTFFNWIPHDSNQIVSPWIAMYFVLTVLSTTFTVYRFQSWAAKRDAEAEQSVNAQLETYPSAGASWFTKQMFHARDKDQMDLP